MSQPNVPASSIMMEEEQKEDGANDNDPKPYEWLDMAILSAEVLNLWNEVGNGLDKSQTVVWKNAVESLENAHTSFRSSPEARAFVEKYMTQIVGILTDQIPSKIGNFERECVQDSLTLAVSIVALDLEIQIERRGVCVTLKTLEHVFMKRKNYYKAKGNNPGAWHHGAGQGLPDVRNYMIKKFQHVGGFKWLAQYMRQTIGTPHFVEIETLRHILSAAADLILRQHNNTSNAANTVANPALASGKSPEALRKELEEDAIDVGEAVMAFITHLADGDLKKIPVEQLSALQQDLQVMFDRLVATRRDATYAFYAFWRRLAWKLLSSSSLPLQLFGWESVGELIEACEKHRPPPRSFWVQGAGCTFANGLYHYNGPATIDGYHRPGAEISYTRAIPLSDPQQGGHKLTLFRCTMRSQQKWWFLSEADEEQPGTDRDIDYYQHKSSKDQEEPYPPATGWTTCRTAGLDPPPTMSAIGWMVPPGEEHNTLEHQLAMWAIDQKIVEQVLGDTTSHREVVARSTALIKFLAQMCSRDDAVLAIAPPQLSEEMEPPAVTGTGDDSSTKENKEQETVPTAAGDGTAGDKIVEKMNTDSPNGGQDNSKYCLQASHLLFAWKTCTRKADAAVSAQVYQLLVSILPLCPPELAIPLLQAVQKSLDDPVHNSEVGEFCGALAEGHLLEPPSVKPGVPPLEESVRLEILNLLWAVLTHPVAPSLKSYDNIKRYVNLELRGEKGAEHRERFLRFCVAALAKSAAGDKIVDETQALLMVRLTQFVVEACPRPQADAWAIQNNCAFPKLLFDELKAYMLRRKDSSARRFARKTASVSSSSSLSGSVLVKTNSTVGGSNADTLLQHKTAFQDRLRILRHVYGLSDPRAGPNDPIVMSADMIKSLWALCSDPVDRESMVIFIAGASHNGKILSDAPVIHLANTAVAQQQPDHTILSPAFTEDVCRQIFLDLFCADDFDFSELGFGGYKSFHSLFLVVRRSLHSSPSDKRAALDVQWRLCLRASADDVAQQAMRDLLAVYIAAANSQVAVTDVSGNQMMVSQSTPLDDDFGDRIFQCLSKVKEDIRNGFGDADRAAERCIRILNASVGQQIDNLGSYSSTPSTLTRLSALSKNATLHETQRCLPHGLRGQAACFRVAITSRRNPLQNSSSNLLAAASAAPAPRFPNTSRFTLDVHPLESLLSVKRRIAVLCECPLTSVKPLHVSGRRGMTNAVEPSSGNFSLNSVPEDSVMDELGIIHGCEMVVSISDRIQSSLALASSSNRAVTNTNDLSEFFFNDDTKFTDQLFSVLMELLNMLSDSSKYDATMDVDGAQSATASTRHLIWDLLQSMPTNSSILSRVLSAATKKDPPVVGVEDAMEIDSSGDGSWSQLLDASSLNRAVYVLLTIDATFNPALAAFSILPVELRETLEKQQSDEAATFRRHFVESGGFAAVVSFFSREDNHDSTTAFDSRRGNAVALRILKSCLFAEEVGGGADDSGAGNSLVQSLSNTEGLLKSLTSMVVDDSGVPSSTVIDVLRFLRLLFNTPNGAESFMHLPRDLAKRFVMSLLVKDDDEADSGRFSASINSSMQVRAAVSEMILQTPLLADGCLQWLIEAVEKAEVKSETTAELFNTLEKLVAEHGGTARSQPASDAELEHLALVVCQTLSSCPRPVSESDLADVSTGVLCGCFRLLRALVEKSSGDLLRPGTDLLINSLSVIRWSDGVTGVTSDDVTCLDLMGVIFDGLLTPSEIASIAICCDKESRREGFDVVASLARKCKDGKGYSVIVDRINHLVSVCSPSLRHRWGEFGGQETHSRVSRASKYSGLRNQGCTCYMNSALQQLFMMPQLRHSMCAAPLPKTLRGSGGFSSRGAELVGKKIALQWDSGVSYEAVVESFDVATGMHTIRYSPVQVATVNSAHQQIRSEDIDRLPAALPDEFVLADGRPGKETGIYEVIQDVGFQPGSVEQRGGGIEPMQVGEIKESEDETASRRLLEETQRTFIHLAEGSKGRCFDPRALVEACACLKLEFDVWQQNDASEFVTKLLDRLEVSLKKWAPDSFKYLDHTFGLKQTSQKICKECGLKTNKEEKLINIDCQIRGKSDIHEALAAMCQADVMEGSNKVSCDRCKKKTDTILRTAVSTLPNVLVLSLKRFDLDFNTFETVKLNSRCAFGHTLNMKPYTIEGIEALEAAEKRANTDDPAPMETDSNEFDPLAALPDENYEYKLAGVLVHAGVAQGGHYYSFIRDRNTDNSDGEEKWYRFDDEDVTVFNPSLIETECFGGKIKKETKWPNGQVHTVEQEQFANALMLFYEKVKTTPTPEDEKSGQYAEVAEVPSLDGYATFKADVQQTNATHKLQSFLFDSECQLFLKALLGICNSTGTELSPLVAGEWQGPLLQSILGYFFDIFLYSSDKPFLNEWALFLEQTLLRDKDSSLHLVRKLAKKTSEISGNWLRTYLLDCPDRASREASVKIFSAAVASSASSETEMNLLESWAKAFEEMSTEILTVQQEKKELRVYPPQLTGERSVFEDTSKIDSGASSSLGVIFSFVNILLDYLPRCWRFSVEPCAFVRALANVRVNDGYVFRKPLVQCLMPARLIALASRDRSPRYLQLSFPGVSCPIEVATTQMRAEQSTSHQAIGIGSNQAIGNDMKSSRGPGHFDYLVILESLACLAGIPHILQTLLYYESDEGGHSLDRMCLTDEAVGALTTIFNEHCTPGAPGMGQREIEMYLRTSGIEANSVSPQKIADLMTKYPPLAPVTGSPGREAPFLTLEAFLAYYRDAIQSNEGRVQQDLHIFGFRPDLSRRSYNARIVVFNERESIRRPAESVGIDIAESINGPIDIGTLATHVLGASPHLFSLAFDVSEPLAEYLIAAAVYKRDPDSIVTQTLMTIHRTPNDWSGNLSIGTAARALMVIASIPDEHQDARIGLIMQNNSRPARDAEYGSGLLHVLRAFHRGRQAQHYSNDFHWGFDRYITILKDLRVIYPVYQWMNENREKWSFLERDLNARASGQYQASQQRGDYGQRETDGHMNYQDNLPVDHQSHTDSDMAGPHESEDDDEDSQCDNLDTYGHRQQSNHGPFQIIIENAGTRDVNGTYYQDGFFEGACKYSRQGRWKNVNYKFYIFQCHVSNNTRHWYISIVPSGGSPGTSADIDFYTAPVSSDCTSFPPVNRWTKGPEGAEPPPSLRFLNRAEVEENDPSWIMSGDGDENQDGAQQHRYV